MNVKKVPVGAPFFMLYFAGAYVVTSNIMRCD